MAAPMQGYFPRDPKKAASLLGLAIDVKRDYGASGSNSSTTGSIDANSTTLTLAAAEDFANGQGISVAGAGASGALLVTQIVSGAGTTSLVLKDAAGTTVADAAVNHDDGAAVRSAVAKAQTATNGVGIVYFPAGEYSIASYTTLGSGNYEVSAGIAADVYLQSDTGQVQLQGDPGAIINFTAAQNGSIPTYAVYMMGQNGGNVSSPYAMGIVGLRIHCTAAGAGGVLIRDTGTPLLRDVRVVGSQDTESTASTADGIRFESSDETGAKSFVEGITVDNVSSAGFEKCWHFAINGGTGSFAESQMLRAIAHIDQADGYGFYFDSGCGLDRSTFTSCGGWVDTGVVTGSTNIIAMFICPGGMSYGPTLVAPFIENLGDGIAYLIYGSGGQSQYRVLNPRITQDGNDASTDMLYALQYSSPNLDVILWPPSQVSDDFTRANATTLGQSSSGYNWIQTAAFSGSTIGIVSDSATVTAFDTSSAIAEAGIQMATGNVDVECDFTTPSALPGTAAIFGIRARSAMDGNVDGVDLELNFVSGASTISLLSTSNNTGSENTTTIESLSVTLAASTTYRMRLRVIGNLAWGELAEKGSSGTRISLSGPGAVPVDAAYAVGKYATLLWKYTGTTAPGAANNFMARDI
jgi:hypothetical protein